MADDLVVVYVSDDEIEGQLYKGMLEEAEIPVIIKSTPGMMGQRTIFAGPSPSKVALLVPAEEAERARELVASFREEAESGRLMQNLEEPDEEE
ncbi:MAG: putative signal transducing protein [Armatimonadota bacterium]